MNGKFLQKMKKILLDFVGLEEEEIDTRDPSELTEAERWVRDEIAYGRFVKNAMSFQCFGIHYSESYLRSKPAEEVYAQWQKDLAEIDDYIEKCMQEGIEERRLREEQEQEQLRLKAERKQERQRKRQERKDRRRKRKEKMDVSLQEQDPKKTAV